MNDLAVGVVRILSREGGTAGTGFLVDGGLIVTASHVIGAAADDTSGSVQIATRLTPRAQVPAKVRKDWSADPRREDITILELENGVPSGMHPFVLGSSLLIADGPLWTFGFPAAKATTGLPGKIEGLRPTEDDRGYSQVGLRSSEVTVGFSGAPVVDERTGVVVGMIVSILPPDSYGRQSDTCFMRPAEMIGSVCPKLILSGKSPYLGLDTFRRENAAIYFGRDREASLLVERLTSERVLLVVGASGSGKSSFLRAGLERGLRAAPVPSLITRERLVMIPGVSPLVDLVVGLGAMSPDKRLELGALLGFSGIDFWKTENRSVMSEGLSALAPGVLSSAIRVVYRRPGLILVIDQFERVFTECAHDARSGFLNAVLDCESDDISIVCALRADFYSNCLQTDRLGSLLGTDAQVTLAPMARNALRQVIVGPAEANGHAVDEPLTSTLIESAVKRAAYLPLLELTLDELWRTDASKGVLTLESYDSLGYLGVPGIDAVLVRKAEAVWQEFDDEQRVAAEGLLLRLMGLSWSISGDGPSDVSRTAWLTELDDEGRDVAKRFARPDTRLMSLDFDIVHGQPTVEVVHEAVLRHWDRAQRLRERASEFLRWHEPAFVAQLRQWLVRGDQYLQGSALKEALGWLEREPSLLTGPERQLIQRSAEVSRDERRLVAEAEQYTRRHRSLMLAERARSRSEEDFAKGLVLAAEALEAAESPEAMSSMLRLLSSRPEIAGFRNAGNGPIRAVAIVDAWTAVTSDDSATCVWTPEGDLFVAGTRDELSAAGRVWPAQVRQLLDQLERGWERTGPSKRFLGESITSVSDNGNFEASVFTAGISRVGIHVISVEQSEVLYSDGVPNRGPFAEYDVAVSNDGSAVSGGQTNSVTIWNRGRDRLMRSAKAHRATVSAVSFAPTGDSFISGDLEGHAVIWTLDRPPWPRLATAFESIDYADVSALALGDRDLLCVIRGGFPRPDLIYIWEWHVPDRPPVVIECPPGPGGVSEDASTVAWTQDPLHAVVWHRYTGERLVAPSSVGPIRAMALSGDGGLLAIGGTETLVVDTLTGEELQRIPLPGDKVQFGAGLTLACNGSVVNCRTGLYMMRPSDEFGSLESHDGLEEVAAFDPSGAGFATAGREEVWLGRLRVGLPEASSVSWLTDETRLLYSRLRVTPRVMCMAYRPPHGRFLAVGGTFDQVRWIDVESTQMLSVGLGGDEGWRVSNATLWWHTYALAFSPDGNHLAAASGAHFDPHAAGLSRARADCAIILWDTSPESWIQRARRLAGVSSEDRHLTD